jgi:hypothetical protein
VNALRQNRKVMLGAAGAAFALLLVGGWLLLVSPERSKATELAGQVDAAQVELVGRQVALRHPAAKVTVRASDGYRLATALPGKVDMPGVILDIQRLASRNKLLFVSIQPQPGAGLAGNGYVATPVALDVQGRFSDVSNFLSDLRTLVRVRHGHLDTRGRLYSVGSVDIGAPQAPATFPVVMAKLTLNTFAFSPPPPVTPSTTPSTPSSGQSSSENVAAGETP